MTEAHTRTVNILCLPPPRFHLITYCNLFWSKYTGLLVNFHISNDAALRLSIFLQRNSTHIKQEHASCNLFAASPVDVDVITHRQENEDLDAQNFELPCEICEALIPFSALEAHQVLISFYFCPQNISRTGLLLRRMFVIHGFGVWLFICT